VHLVAYALCLRNDLVHVEGWKLLQRMQHLGPVAHLHNRTLPGMQTQARQEVMPTIRDVVSKRDVAPS
jgi:hypothetical protein